MAPQFPQTANQPSYEGHSIDATWALAQEALALAKALQAAQSGSGMSPLTTKGDLFTRDADGDARLGVSFDRKVLRADSGAAVGLAWGQLNQDDILAAFAPSVSLSITEKEIGDGIDGGYTGTPQVVSVSYNRPAAFATVNDGSHGDETLAAPYTSKRMGHDYTSSVIGDVVTFTVTAHEAGGVSNKTSAAACTWKARCYYDAQERPAGPTYDEAWIKALSSSQLKATSAQTCSYNAGATERCYLALPASMGATTASFYDSVSGMPVNMTKVAAGVNVTNAFSVTVAYDVWESDETNWGVETMGVR